MAIELTDDGTMDTVLRCSECGQEFRFNYEPGPDDEDREASYDIWIEECIADVESEHVCPSYHVDTWFERDRQHVALYYGSEGDANDDLVIEWRDDAVTEAVEDGFLNPKDWLHSAVAYAFTLGLTKGRK